MCKEHMVQTRTCTLQLRTSQRKPFVESKQPLPSQLHTVSPFIDRLMRFVAMFRGADGSEVDFEVALLEAILNAVIHGNAEDPEKRVYVTCRCTIDGEVSISIRDGGGDSTSTQCRIRRLRKIAYPLTVVGST
jgi:serine/threonine-protein kinase RsbW